jgi:transcriptional regulator with XRE-family HTH domain
LYDLASGEIGSAAQSPWRNHHGGIHVRLLGERIRELRKERGWSQGELGTSIGADAQQVSRYENGRITPSAEVIVKIAETFDVSLDYLLVESSARRPLHVADEGLVSRLGDLRDLSEEDRGVLFHMVDALRAKNRFKSLAADLG